MTVSDKNGPSNLYSPHQTHQSQQLDAPHSLQAIPETIPERILHPFLTVRARALRSQGRMSIDFVQRLSTPANKE
jgi:hypothetical protein